MGKVESGVMNCRIRGVSEPLPDVVILETDPACVCKIFYIFNKGDHKKRPEDEWNTEADKPVNNKFTRSVVVE
jgi:hypothetical protein